jgi:membrane-associated protease RseP (regulator of RpoE activity)
MNETPSTSSSSSPNSSSVAVADDSVTRVIDLTESDASTVSTAAVVAKPAPTRVNPVVASIVASFVVVYSVVTGNTKTLVVALALGFMIFMHELGHFVTARLTGMKATEFFIGFGPRVWSFTRGETEYGIKAIPLGGYVKILGMTNVETIDDPTDEPRTYRQQSYPRRILVASAGSIMHMIMAFVCFASVLSGFGQRIEKVDGLKVGAFGPVGTAPSPAEKAGFKKGEVLLSVNGKAVEVSSSKDGLVYNLPQLLEGSAGKDVVFELGETVGYTKRSVTVRPVLDTADGKSVSRIGIQLDTKIGSVETVRVPIATGARKAGAQIVELAPLTFKALGKFFAPDQLTKYSKAVANAGTPGATKDIDDTRFMSPVGTVNMLAAASNNSFTDGIMLFGAINVFVGMFNMVPMLPLDGGHVLVATYERIRSTRKRRYIADVRKLMPAAYAVMFLMLMLGISSLYLDLRAPISLP